MIIVGVNKKLESEYASNPVLSIKVSDSQAGIISIKDTPGLQVLTEQMKQALVDGITALRDELCLKAYFYYRTHDFEPTEKVIKVMRTVVEISLAKVV